MITLCYSSLFMEIRYSIVIVRLREWYLTLSRPFLMRNVNMTLLKRILREPVFSGRPVLSGNY